MSFFVRLSSFSLNRPSGNKDVVFINQNSLYNISREAENYNKQCDLFIYSYFTAKSMLYREQCMSCLKLKFVLEMIIYSRVVHVFTKPS